MAPDEKKRRNMTFRVRDELRDAVEELARANGRSLSEQVEYYVESSVISEIGLIYQYSTDALSPILFRFSASRDRMNSPSLEVKFPSEHREMLTIAGKNHLNTIENNSLVPWVKEPGGHQHAIDMAGSLIDGIVRGALESLEATLGPEVVADLQANFRIGDSRISIKLKRAYQELEMRCKAAESEIESLRFHSDSKIKHLQSQIDSYRKMLAGPGTLEGEFERVAGDLATNTAGLAPVHPRMPMPADLPPAETRGGGDFSMAALRELLGRVEARPSALGAIHESGWPRQFDDLPADTRSRLIGDLPAEAPALYRTLMSPDAPRSQILSALRRLRGVLLGEEEDEGPDEDLGDMEGQKAHRGR